MIPLTRSIRNTWVSSPIYPPKVENQFSKMGKIAFPAFANLNCNMMPFQLGEKKSLPKEYHPYLKLIEACNLKEEEGTICFLTINESWVKKGKTQRRGGIHTERHGPLNSWGGGPWGGG